MKFLALAPLLIIDIGCAVITLYCIIDAPFILVIMAPVALFAAWLGWGVKYLYDQEQQAKETI